MIMFSSLYPQMSSQFKSGYPQGYGWTEVMLLKDPLPFSTHPSHIIKLPCSFLFAFHSPYRFSSHGALVTVFQRYIGYSIRYIEIYVRRFITGIGSCDYSGREVPRSAICKLENPESGGIIQSKSEVQTPSAADITPHSRPKVPPRWGHGRQAGS